MTIVSDSCIPLYGDVVNNGHFTYFGGKVTIPCELVAEIVNLFQSFYKLSHLKCVAKTVFYIFENLWFLLTELTFFHGAQCMQSAVLS